MVKNLKLSMMEDSKQFDLSKGIFATYENENGLQELKLETILPYWEYATEDELESISIGTNGTNIKAEFTCASGQGGVIAFFRGEDGKLIHISNGQYVIADAVYKGYVYALCAIRNFVTPLTYQMNRIRLGTMDAWAEPEVDESFSFDDKEAWAVTLHGETVHLNVRKDAYVIGYSGKEVVVGRKDL